MTAKTLSVIRHVKMLKVGGGGAEHIIAHIVCVKIFPLLVVPHLFLHDQGYCDNVAKTFSMKE